jgi:ABC-2 type transport system permease protein
MSDYSNLRALTALTKASLQSITKSPSAVVFSVAFPLVFIIAFGFLGGGKGFSIKVTNALGSDTTNEMYQALHSIPVLKWVNFSDDAAVQKGLKEGNIVAVIDIKTQAAGTLPKYKINIAASTAQAAKVEQLRAIINQVVESRDPEIAKRTAEQATVSVQLTTMRELKTIDFILPGQLGFSLLAGSVFGTAFVFFNMRQTLVLKRFFATPVRREIIVLSEGIARMFFQLLTALIIIGVGYYAFDYHLIHGFATIAQMLFLCMIGVMVFMGFGFSVSGLAKSESTIPPMANLITMPQFLLAGTFFSIDEFPKWLQPISRAMPLTYLNDALRKTAFEGANLWELRWDVLILLAWGIVIYFVAGRVFKWE